ncbi:MAG: DMT family transporter [Gemmatimonadaceae bacterium]
MPDRSTAPAAFGATDALLLLMAVIWGVNYSAVKYGSLALTPLAFTWLRVFTAMLTLMTVAAIQRNRWPARRDVLWLMALGVLGNGFYQLFFVFGVSRTRVADAALIVAAMPAFIALISRVRGVERVRPRAIGGILLSVAGVGIVMLGSTAAENTKGSAFGALLVFIGVLCWSIFTVAMQPFTHRVNPVQLNALTMTGGMLPLLFLTPFAFTAIQWGNVSAVAWGCLLYSSVISIGLAYLFWYRGIRVLGPTRASVYGNLQPIVAILFGWMALHEAPTVWQIVGTVTIVGGIFLTRA